MIYIQLSTPYRDYDRIRVIELHFYDPDESSVTPPKISFKYQIYKKVGEQEIGLFDKIVAITDENTINQIAQAKNSVLNVYDFACRLLLEDIINNSSETGTLEQE